MAEQVLDDPSTSRLSRSQNAAALETRLLLPRSRSVGSNTTGPMITPPPQKPPSVVVELSSSAPRQLQQQQQHHRRQSAGGSFGSTLSLAGGGARSSFRSGSLGQSSSSMRRDPDSRIIYINDPNQTNEKYEIAGNEIRSSKYSVFSFLPLNLFEQFHRLAYVYFLVIIVLNQIPQLAVFGRTVSLFPLLFVLIVTAIKDGYEDWRRHRSDAKENNRCAMVLRNGDSFESTKWKHVRVGEVLKVSANETIPCDMVLLSTSDASGLAYLQTTNLDGETNLKTRYARPETSSVSVPIVGTIVCRKPERNIYEFTAYIDLEQQRLPLGPTNIILRGCQLKNTSWVVGVAVYAGQETKAMLNSSGPQSKRSRLEKNMNRETIWLSIFLVAICLAGGFGTGFWIGQFDDDLDIIPFYHNIQFLVNTTSNLSQVSSKKYFYYGLPRESIFAFLSFVIMFQVMIPISLYISLELVRLGQSYFMIRDAEMFHSESNSRFQCRALNINEDLGQIKYIFSDKTGTLTENKMEFWSASIHGVKYSEGKVSVEPVSDTKGSIELEDTANIVEDVLGKRTWKPKNGVKVDPKLVRILQDSSESTEREAVHNYLLTLAACNTVVPTKVKLTHSGSLKMEAAEAVDDGIGLIEYQGESPDEQALVSAAASYGYTLLERTANEISVDILGEIQRFRILGIHEFDSTRKCMSMVVECPDKTVKVLVKGADSSILSKLMESKENKHLREITDLHLGMFAREGLRTLAIAKRDLSGRALEEWETQYAKASTALVDRGGMLQESAKLVERDLLLLGVTGIEDKLQDGVPETIKALREAGMKVWVLTGDKQETAISIGFSCALLTDEMQFITINVADKKSCREELLKNKEMYLQRREQSSKGDSLTIGMFPPTNEFDGSESVDGKPLKPLGLVIDGSSLVHALQDDLQQDLYDLASVCKVVLCCRVAPFQKAGIVSLVKRKTSEMTLAIGDGANDVSMIQMADVGIGISGQEGRQAVMASDFAMGQFRFLKRLLLVHGHWNYSRLGYMVLYNFYRNAVFVMLLFWYIIYTAFSPSSAVTDWSRMFFSLIYTSVPTIVVGIFDKDVNARTLLKYPSLYSSGQRDESYSSKLFWITMVDTIWQSLVIFYVPYLAYFSSTIDIWSLGSIWTIAVVLVANLHLAMDAQLWNWITHASIWGSILATYACLFVLDSLTSDDLLISYGTIFNVIKTPGYWLNILLIIGLSLMPRLIVKVVNQRYWPSNIQIAREEEIRANVQVE